MAENLESFKNIDPQGVGVALSINGHTRAMDKFFGKLPPSYGVPMPPDSLHVTILSAEETVIPIESERELLLLRNAEREIHRRLARLPLQAMVMRPAGEELEKFGRFLAIPVHSLPYMESLRQDLIEVCEEEIGVTVNQEINWHMSVVRQNRNRVRARNNTPPFPGALHVNGFDLQRRVYGSDRQGKPKQAYINHPQQSHLRRAI